jgi:hypothetical protein
MTKIRQRRKAKLCYYRFEEYFRDNKIYNQLISLQQAIGLTYLGCFKFGLIIPNIMIHKNGRIKRLGSFSHRHNNITKKTKINYNKHVNIGTVSHEIAHLLQYVRTSTTKDNNDLLPYIIEVQTFFDEYIPTQPEFQFQK